jgi:spermidine/putrescine ABC transporter ATP-binding subunit
VADVRLDALTKRFGSVVALDRLGLHAADGELVAVLGPSGAGKSTLLGLVAGFEPPSAGGIHIGGEDVTERPAHRREVGVLFQNYALFPHLTVAANVEFALRVRRWPRGRRREAARRALAMVDLLGFEDRHPGQLSGGQQQRVALARAVVFEPRVLLLDEPLGALDRALRIQMQEELRALHRRVGTTTLLVTHDQEEAMTMADRVAVLADGRLMQVGAPRELYEHPRNEFVATFLGAGNLLTGTVTNNGRGRGLLLEEQVLAPLAPDASVVPGERASILVRPENVTLRRPGETEQGLLVEVSDAVFSGPHVVYHLRSLGGRQLTAFAASDQRPFAVGERVRASWDPTRTHVLPCGRDERSEK